MLEDQFPTSETIEQPSQTSPRRRQFPEELMDIPAFLIWRQRNSDSGTALGGFVSNQDKEPTWSMKQNGRAKSRLRDLLPWIAHLEARNDGCTYNVAFFPAGTGYSIVDFDFKAFARKAAQFPEKAERIAREKALMAEWVHDLAGHTFTEQSKTRGSYHVLFKYPFARRAIGANLPDDATDDERDNSKLPIDFLGTGYIVMTGDRAEIPDPETGELRRAPMHIAEPTPDITEWLEAHWDRHSDTAPQLDHIWFGHGVERRQVMVDHERIYHRSINPDTGQEVYGFLDGGLKQKLLRMNPRYQWYLTGDGETPDAAKKGASEGRLDFLQAMAAAAYDCKDAPKAIEELLFDSWFAHEYTPNYSEGNGDRFTNNAKVNFVKNHEIPLALGLAYEAVQIKKLGTSLATWAAWTIEERERRLTEHAADAEAQEEARRNFASSMPPIDEVFFPRLIKKAFREMLSVPNISEVENTLPFWEAITVTAFNGICASMVIRPAGAGCAPSMFIMARTGEGKTLIPGFVLSVLGGLDNTPDALQVFSSFTGGAAIRDKVTQGTLVFATIQEGKETLTKMSAAASSAGADNSYQTYLPETLAGMPRAKEGRANSGKQFEGEHVSDPLLSLFMFIQPHFVEEAIRDPKTSVKGLLTGGFFGRVPGMKAPKRGENEPALYCAEPRFYHPAVAFLRQIMVAATQRINVRKSFSFKHTNTSAFLSWLRDGMVNLGPLDEAANRFPQLCAVYALQHAFARSITVDHYKAFLKEYWKRRKDFRFATLGPRAERPAGHGDIVPQMISFVDQIPDKKQGDMIYIMLPQGVAQEDYDFGREIVHQHAAFLLSLFTGQAPGIVHADMKRLAVLTKLQNCISNSDEGTFTARDVTRSKGLGQGHAQKVSDADVVQVLGELMEIEGVLCSGPRKGTYAFTEATRTTVATLIEQAGSE